MASGPECRLTSPLSIGSIPYEKLPSENMPLKQSKSILRMINFT